MAEKKKQRKYQLVFQSTSPLLKVVVTALIVFSMAALLALAWVRSGINARIQELKRDAASLEQENRELEEKIGELGSMDSLQDIAREELGLVDPDTIVIQPQ